jgi:hypothetical protein
VGLIAIVAVSGRTAAFAKRQDSILQCPHAGEPQCPCGGIEPVILPDERRNTLAVTVCLSGRPGKSWCQPWLDEDAEGNGVAADADSGGHQIGRRGNHRHVVGVGVRDIDLAAVRGHRHPDGLGKAGVGGG